MYERPLLIPLIRLDATETRAVRAIYDATFPDDERVSWERLWQWYTAPGENFGPVFWAVIMPPPGTEDENALTSQGFWSAGLARRGTALELAILAGEVAGLAFFGYFRRQNLGYFAYLATRTDLRGRGLGAWLCGQVFEAVRQLAQAEAGADPRLIFWEVRRPEDAADEAEAERRRRRIAFYERLGARLLPIDYTCPPVTEGQPPVAFTVMARTYPPARPLTCEEALDVALTGLIEANGAEMGDEYTTAAVRSVKAGWG
jgi:GNAT superfamily N-acetyltransferase